MKAVLVFILLIATVFGLLVAGSYWVTYATCEARWMDSGFESRFSVFGGCQIKLKNGTWISVS